jgi:branched-chain amino acid transport system permease protein
MPIPHPLQILSSGLFGAAIFFLVAAGLQLVFGVQKIVNLAAGSFYALGAYFGLSAANWAVRQGLPPHLFVLALIAGGLLLGVFGPLLERFLSPIYERDEAFQLLLTFALLLMLEDVMRFVWGPVAQSTGTFYLIYGQAEILGTIVPMYNLVVIGSALLVAVGLAFMLSRTSFGRIIRATADNREMAEALGVNMRVVYMKVFTLGMMLGTLGGALIVPAIAPRSEMGVDILVETFAVVVIGGLGSMWGALAAAILVGLIRSLAISTFPAAEMLVVYLIVIAVLVLRPQGLFGRESVT